MSCNIIKQKEDTPTFLALLKACAKKKDMERGTRVHAAMAEKGLLIGHSALHLASALIHMYATCGDVSKAQEVLGDLLVRDVVTWNALISGYARSPQHGFEALDCFQRMQCEGISPNAVSFTCISQACGSIKSLETGKRIHGSILNSRILDLQALDIGTSDDACTRNTSISYSDACALDMCTSGDAHFASNAYLANEEKDIVVVGASLVDMYAKCGAADEAWKVLEGLRFRNVVAWNALISGYIHHGQDLRAMGCFEAMQKEGLCPNEVTFICILKACGNVGDIEKGEKICEEVASKGFLKKYAVLGNALTTMYAKCGMLAKARKLLGELPFRDQVSWNAIISEHAKQGRCSEAIECYESMKSEGFSPDRVTFICTLNACAKSGAIEKGQEIHERISSMGLVKKDIVLGNALIDMYAKCGRLGKAHECLKELLTPNVVSWNALIAGYVHRDFDYETLRCFECMRNEGLFPDRPTFLSILKACASTKAAEKGKGIHVEILSRGSLTTDDTVLGTALVDMYVKCGMLGRAHRVLDELSLRDAVSWSAVIAGYARRGRDREAMECLERMQTEGLAPNAITFACILQACGKKGSLEDGKRMHEEILRRGLSNDDLSLASASVSPLARASISMYAKCGAVERAKQLLEELPERDTPSWNALMEGYAEKGQGRGGASDCLDRMLCESVLPDDFTFICMAKACANGADSVAVRRGKQAHCRVVRMGRLEKGIVLGTALVDMYAKWGWVEKAEKLLLELPLRSAATWNALILGYANRGRVHEASVACERMQIEGESLDEITFMCMLKACGSAGALARGEELHGGIVRGGLLRKAVPDAPLGTALMEMYSRCGVLARAEQVWEELRDRDVVAWSALVAGYARRAEGQRALECLACMRNEGIAPDRVALLCALSACSRSGLLCSARILFRDMARRHRLLPAPEHCSCLVLALGHGGHLGEAVSVIESLPSLRAGERQSIWLAFLGVCRKWAAPELGRLAFDRALRAGIAAASGMNEKIA